MILILKCLKWPLQTAVASRPIGYFQLAAYVLRWMGCIGGWTDKPQLGVGNTLGSQQPMSKFQFENQPGICHRVTEAL